jgi:hypothetical protein
MGGILKKAFASLQPVMWIHNAVMTLSGILATHLLHVLTLKHRWDRLPLKRLLPVVMLACVVLALTISIVINSVKAFAVGPSFGVRSVGHCAKINADKEEIRQTVK